MTTTRENPPFREWRDSLFARLAETRIRGSVNVDVRVAEAAFAVGAAHTANIVADLEAACRAAREWLAAFAEHSPTGFGGEAELDEQLRAALGKVEGE